MEINEFAVKVCNAVKRELGEEYRTELREVRKNNGVMLHGLLVRSRAHNVAPTIYLEGFLEAYEAGATFASIVRRLVGIYREDVPGDGIDMAFFQDFEKVRDRICYRLIGRRGNGELLEEVPHIEFLDLAICFYYAYRGEALGEGMILIHHSHAGMWGISARELFGLAESNTPRLFPWECSSLEDILAGTADQSPECGDACGEPEGMPMCVLSNRKRIHGAACMLYPRVLEDMAERLQSGFYILPSSIHEVILLTCPQGDRTAELRRMIREVNGTQVAPEEILSDNLYYYDFIEKKVKIIF